MRFRSVAGFAAVAVLAITACGGGDGGSTLSEDDFLDELADLCSDVQSDVDDIAEPESTADVEDFAKDVLELYTDAREQLGELGAPDDLADDYDDFLGVIDDQIAELEDLEDAGKDEDEDAINEILEKMGKLAEDQAEIADELGVDECGADAGDDPVDTTPVDTGAPTTAPPTTSATPLTLPPTVPATVPPGTTPATTPSTGGQLFSVIDLTERFVPPSGFQLASNTPDQPTIDLFVSIPALNTGMAEMGVATLVTADGTEVADIWIGIATGDAMPADWKTVDCGDSGELRTSAGGITGIVCYGAADSPTYEIFTATQGSVGISVYTLIPDVTGDLVADAFLEANLGG